MELPKRFKVQSTFPSRTVYTVIEDGDNSWRVEWTQAGDGKPDYLIYKDSLVRSFLSSGGWVRYTDPLDPVEEADGLKPGDHVVIKNPKVCYDLYDAFAERHGLSGFRACKFPTAGRKGVIALIAAGQPDAGNMIYAIRMGERGMFLMGREGIEKEPEVTTNGFDALGKPLLFTREDVKPGMRVEFQNGELFLAIPNMQAATIANEGSVALCGFGAPMYMFINFEKIELSDWDIAKVFAAPENNSSFAVKCSKTGLLWQRKDPAVAQKLSRTAKLKEELAQVTKNVLEGNERMQRIKEELRSI